MLRRKLQGTAPVHTSLSAPSVSSRIVLPYHPVWSNAGFSSALLSAHEAHLNSLGEIGYAKDSSVGIAWSLAKPHLHSRLQSMARRKVALPDP